MTIANETSNVESERWVIIGDTVILVSHNERAGQRLHVGTC